MIDLPTKALSIMQPWAGLIVHGYKDIENRDWVTSFRGPILIHAGKRLDRDALTDILSGQHPVTGESTEAFRGLNFQPAGIVGVAEIVDCVASSPSPWFVGRFGFVIRDARPLPFIPCRGALGIFTPDLSGTT